MAFIGPLQEKKGGAIEPFDDETRGEQQEKSIMCVSPEFSERRCRP